jgi:hypothetical protein
MTWVVLQNRWENREGGGVQWMTWVVLQNRWENREGGGVQWLTWVVLQNGLENKVLNKNTQFSTPIKF